VIHVDKEEKQEREKKTDSKRRRKSERKNLIRKQGKVSLFNFFWPPSLQWQPLQDLKNYYHQMIDDEISYVFVTNRLIKMTSPLIVNNSNEDLKKRKIQTTKNQSISKMKLNTKIRKLTNSILWMTVCVSIITTVCCIS